MNFKITVLWGGNKMDKKINFPKWFVGAFLLSPVFFGLWQKSIPAGLFMGCIVAVGVFLISTLILAVLPPPQ